MSTILFKRYQKFLQRYFESAIQDKHKIKQGITQFSKVHDIKDSTLMNRFSRKDIKTLIKVECPVEIGKSPNGFKYFEEQEALKKLRNLFDVSESLACSSCSKQEICKVKYKVPEEKKASVTDLLIFMNAFVMQTESAKQELSSQGENDDEQSSQSEDNSDSSNSESEGEEGQQSDENLAKEYISALRVMDTLYSVVDDLTLNKGIESKLFINTWKTHEKENEKQVRINFKEYKKQQKQKLEEQQENEEETEEIDQGEDEFEDEQNQEEPKHKGKSQFKNNTGKPNLQQKTQYNKKFKPQLTLPDPDKMTQFEHKITKKQPYTPYNNRQDENQQKRDYSQKERKYSQEKSDNSKPYKNYKERNYEDNQQNVKSKPYKNYKDKTNYGDNQQNEYESQSYNRNKSSSQQNVSEESNDNFREKKNVVGYKNQLKRQNSPLNKKISNKEKNFFKFTESVE